MTPAALRLLCEQATPGPWFYAYNRVCSKPLFDEYNASERDIPADAPDDDPRWDMLPNIDVCYVDTSHGDTPSPRGQRDAAFIAAARTALPALLDDVDRLTKELEAANDATEQIVTWLETLGPVGRGFAKDIRSGAWRGAK